MEASGTEMQIINTHLGLPAYERMAQAKTLLGQNWIGHPDCRDPVILLGDFNARRRSVVYRMFTTRLRDAQLVLHKRARRTFPARMPMLRIDHIFCSRSVDVLGVEVPRSRSSARRRITCRWSWTSASSNMSGLGYQQRPRRSWCLMVDG